MEGWLMNVKIKLSLFKLIKITAEARALTGWHTGKVNLMLHQGCQIYGPWAAREKNSKGECVESVERIIVKEHRW